MKIQKLISLFAAIIALTVAGCASLGAPNTEALLSAAGFVSQTPSTPKQQAFYSSLSPFELQRDTVKGKPVYVYADKKQDVVYFGNEQAYQRYKALGLKQQLAEDDLAAAEMEEDDALDWNGLGPWGDGFWY